MHALFKAGPPAAAPLPFGARPQAQELYYIVNNERATNGLGPVVWHDQLGGLAQSWSDYMAVTGNYSHQDLDAVLQNPAYAGYSGLGENILHGGCGTSDGDGSGVDEHLPQGTSSATSAPSSAWRATARSLRHRGVRALTSQSPRVPGRN